MRVLQILLVSGLSLATGAPGPQPGTVYPGTSWEIRTPAETGLDTTKLEAIRDYLGGRGFVSRHGYQVYSWGAFTERGDVASAAKPWYAHFLFKAVEEGRLSGVDARAEEYLPQLATINERLGRKDRNITFRHLATQTSGYGIREAPGAAFDYNDWQMALFWDALFLGVWEATYDTVDAAVLHPQLTDLLECEDSPTFMAFGRTDRAGRLAVSPRDFARFGLLYLRGGLWKGRQLSSRASVARAVSSPLPNSIPRTAGEQSDMIPGQRSMGSRLIPDNQTDHKGSYSWLWWVNGVDRRGGRLWPDAPLDVFACLGHRNGKRGLAVIPSLDIVISWNDSTLDKRPEDPHPLNEVFRLLVQAAPGPMTGQIVADAGDRRWLRRHGGGPFFMCGPGDPEGFLYRGTRNADGTRSGDQEDLIRRLEGTGANSIYLMAVRSHGGDGGPTENPFIDSDPSRGLDEGILQQWEGWFRQMDESGIVIFFFFYDDGALIWDGDSVGSPEREFLRTLVNRFEHHKNLIWCVAEEYSEAYSASRARNIAAVIREADDHDHPIAVHKLTGLDFSEFAGEPDIDQFAIQYNAGTAREIHAGIVAAWKEAAGRYNLNMSEAADYGTGAEARRKDWACALGGAYSMRLGMDIAGSAISDLEDCGRLVKFMESTDFDRMSPHDELALGGTEYVLALPGSSYIAYASNLTGHIGLRAMTAGTYDFTWLDCAVGTLARQTAIRVGAGDQDFPRPAGIGDELAVWITRSARR